jgi:5'-methylthioadenosine phosphorylase
MSKADIGIIGGSGIYDVDGVKKIEEIKIETPYGDPSDTFLICEIAGKRVAFLPRHGRGHRLLPSEVNSRANMWAFKFLGVRQVLAFSAVGSLKAELAPKQFVVPDQVIDKTFRRPGTYFGDGIVGHVAFGHPFCERLRKIAVDAAAKEEIAVTDGGLYICMEGPQFSTRAESLHHVPLGASLIGMTAMPEAKLAREAELCYSIVALVTDYDCWHEDLDHVTVGAVMETMKANIANAKKMLPGLIAALPASVDCKCRHALDGAIMTDPAVVPAAAKERTALLTSRFFQ